MKSAVTALVLITVTAALLALLVLFGQGAVVLNPAGWVGLKERRLFFITIALMLIVVVPVFVLMPITVWRYRVRKKQAKYAPEWDHHRWIELVWWSVPFVVIAILGVINWHACHQLDPFKPLSNGKEPLKIQVVALQWKWLFIYPEQKLASVNFLQFPEQTPISFEITADAPMNSFWIPQLGGQIYAMPGMRSKLHLIADEVGTFRGSSANLSGLGFAGMHFQARASTADEFDEWVQSARGSEEPLNLESYDALAMPSERNPVALYPLADENLFDAIMAKYLVPPSKVKV